MAICNLAEIEADACASGFKGLSAVQFRMLLLQLFCNQTGGGGGGAISPLTQVFAGNYGGVEPPFSPTASAAIATDTSNGTQWPWYNGAWHS